MREAVSEAAPETLADRRVHPATIPIRLLKEAPSTIIGLPAFLAIASDVGWLTILGVATAATLVGTVQIYVRWRRLRYGLGESEFVIESGLVSRTRRSIPFDRVQDVGIERGPLQRLFGLAKVRIETGGGGKDEGLLDSLSMAEADRLRAAVRAWRAGAAPAVAAAPQAEAAAEAAEPIFAMTLARVAAAGLFNFSLVYLAGLFALLQTFKEWLPFDIYDPGRWIGLVDDRLASRMTPTALLAVLLLALLLGSLFGVARTLARDFGFRLWSEGGQFRRERGLFTRTEVILPKRRVQLARLQTGPLRRRWNWSALYLQTLSPEDEGGGQQSAAPLATDDEIAVVLAEHPSLRLPQADELNRVSRLHVWRMLAGHLLPPIAIFTAATIAWRPAALSFALLPLLFAIAAIQRRFHLYGLADGLLFIRRGVIRRQLWIIPTAKIQSLALKRSPLQRRLGLATIEIDTAGGSAIEAPRVVDIREANARALLQQLGLAAPPA